MKSDIRDLLDFTLFTNEIRKVKRAVWVIGEEVYENDCEHSYQLAMTALYIIETNHLKLDAFKAMGLAMVHDILEVHAGDTPAFSEESALVAKVENEKQAIAQLQQQWPNLKLMHQLIAEFEAKSTPESKFVYALDKLVPILNNYLDNGRNWKREGFDLNRMIQIKSGKVDIDPTIDEYYQQILDILQSNPEIFKNN